MTMQASSSSSSAGSEYVSSFTSPAMPNLPKVAGLSPRKPGTAPRRTPRTPLPPHKLAKLANALGVSTPLPASSPSPGGLRSFSGRSSEDRSTNGGESRSSTPASGFRPSPLSRYLIHVVPPPHFPHESDNDPESYASFRRGSLVPLHQTLQAQLSAIQREFLLPTSQGLVLYLVGDAQISSTHTEDARLGRGPRISDEIWKWMTSRVADEQQLVRGVGLGLSNGSSSPAPSERGTFLRTLSTSSRADNSSSRSNFTASYPLTPSPSSPSTTSISSKRKESPSRQPTSSSASETSSISNAHSPDTPPTSTLDIDPGLLPGLHSPSLIPVLTKVEFDIDRRNGGTWYEAWTRSRRELHGRQRGVDVDDKGKLKLKITMSNNKDTPVKIDVPASPAEKLVEGGIQNEGYARLSESPEHFEVDEELTAREPALHSMLSEQVEGEDGGDDDEDQKPLSRSGSLDIPAREPASHSMLFEQAEGNDGGDDDEDEKPLSRSGSLDVPPQHTPAVPASPDPLADVFGSDDQTWSDLQSTRPASGEASRIRNGDLALDGAALSSLPAPEELPEHEPADDDAEVVQIWSQNDQPALNVPPPTPPRINIRPSLKVSPSGGKQRPIPPPLTLPHSNVLMAVTAATPTASPFLSAQEADDSKLPYLNGSTDRFDVSPSNDESMSNESMQVGPVRTDEKRGGGIYEDLELDLDVSGYTDADVDIGDPDASEADQLKLSSALDVLEQKYQLLSPKELSPMSLPDDVPHSAHPRSPAIKPFSAYISPVTPITPGQFVYTTLPERGRLVPTIQQLQPARKSMEIEEDVSASPPTFRQPLLVGTPSPRADSFSGYASGSTAGNGMPAWPAVPFATAMGRNEEDPISPKTVPLRISKGSPPRVMLNGQARVSPMGPRTNSVSSMSAFQYLPSGVSSESAARSRQHEEEFSNGASRQGPGSSEALKPQAGISPVMPLSPDPFGRFPSSSSFAAAEQFAYETMPASPANGAHGHDDAFEPFVRPPSKTPSSRFSSDSVLEDAKEPPKSEKSKDRATLMSVKSIKKLWRKTNKTSTNNTAAFVNAAANVALPMQPRQSGELHTRPQTPFYGPRTPSQPPQPSRASVSVEPVPHAPAVQPMHRSNGSQSSAALLSQKDVPPQEVKSSQRDSGLDPFYFDQDSKYPVRRSATPTSSQSVGQRSRTPSLSASASLSALPPSPNPQQQMQPPAQPATPALNPPEEKKVKTRKSFLRWRSGNGSSTEGKEKDRQSVDSTSTSSSSAHDHMSRQQKRSSRRPSVADLPRFSSTSSAIDIASPSVPQLPAEYRQSVNRASVTWTQRQSVQPSSHRTSASTSSSEDHGIQRPARTSSLRRKPVPSTSLESNVSTAASSELIHTPAMGSISGTNPLIEEEEDDRNYEFVPSMHQKTGSLLFQPDIPLSASSYD